LVSRSSIVFGARVPCFVVWCIVFSANQRRPCKSCDIAPPWRVIGNSEWEGVLKAKIFKGMYEPELEFPEGWGFQTKNPSVGGVWIFSGTTH